MGLGIEGNLSVRSLGRGRLVEEPRPFPAAVNLGKMVPLRGEADKSGAILTRLFPAG